MQVDPDFEQRTSHHPRNMYGSIDRHQHELPPSDVSAELNNKIPFALRAWLAESTAAVVEENDDKLCIACVDRPREMVFRKCGHMCLCAQCCKKMNRCPICQRKGHAVKVLFV
eukprot:c6585_g1_i2.p3 GENE.c6585_g1_i2~~c6585_g1_i2.p3  ORF type:complete len:113 (+),score=21.00 c6585_g1_i2:354-692(+)